MTDAAILSFDPDGPTGVPGALRSAAATLEVVPVPAKLALRIARQLDEAQAQVNAMQLMTVDRLSSEAMEAIEHKTRLTMFVGFGGGFMWGLVAAYVFWGAA
jgi:hypothetical protein